MKRRNNLYDSEEITVAIKNIIRKIHLFITIFIKGKIITHTRDNNFINCFKVITIRVLKFDFIYFSLRLLHILYNEITYQHNVKFTQCSILSIKKHI